MCEVPAVVAIVTLKLDSRCSDEVLQLSDVPLDHRVVWHGTRPMLAVMLKSNDMKCRPLTVTDVPPVRALLTRLYASGKGLGARG